MAGIIGDPSGGGLFVDQWGRIGSNFNGTTYAVWGYANQPQAVAPAIGPAATAASTGVNPVETSYSLYGHPVPLSVGGKVRIGGEIISGPWIASGLASFIISFGVPADPSGTRTLLEIAFDSEVVWTGTLTGAGTPSSAGFSTEPFTVRFYDGNLTQAADALETSDFGSDAVAYRPQILLAFENLPLANTKFGKIPYVSALLGDTTGDDVNIGEALERLAYSPFCGLTSSQFETSGITDALPDGGFVIAQDMQFLQLIQQLGRFYPTWDILQTDKLRVVDRGDTVTADIVLDDTRLMGEIRTTRKGADTISKELELSTIDMDADYTIVPSVATLPRDPVAVTTSVGKDTAYLPVIMDSFTRMSVATFAKYHEEVARKTISGTAMMYGLEIEPGVLVGIDLNRDDFGSETFKIKETTHGVNYVVEFIAESILKCAPGITPLPEGATFWNPADKSVGITLSDSDQTAAQATTVTGGVRSTTSKTTGKYYLELNVSVMTGDVFRGDGVGLTTLAQGLTTIPGGNSFWIRNDGLMFVGAASTGRSIDALFSQVIGIAVDFDNQRIWARNTGHGTGWAGASPFVTSNPATNTNGIDISSIFSGVAGYLCLTTHSAASETVTINNTWVYPAPAGFSGW